MSKTLKTSFAGRNAAQKGIYQLGREVEGRLSDREGGYYLRREATSSDRRQTVMLLNTL